MTDSQKLAMHAMALMKANNLPDEVAGTVLDLLMQAGWRYCMDMQETIRNEQAHRDQELVSRATKGIH